MRNEKGRKEISTSFGKLHTEEIKKQPLSISRQSSAASADSGLSSTTSSNVTAKHVGNRDPKNYINLPPSPVKSQCSSYGSLTSLGSSSCSASDDSKFEYSWIGNLMIHTSLGLKALLVGFICIL